MSHASVAFKALLQILSTAHRPIAFRPQSSINPLVSLESGQKCCNVRFSQDSLVPSPFSPTTPKAQNVDHYVQHKCSLLLWEHEKRQIYLRLGSDVLPKGGYGDTVLLAEADKSALGVRVKWRRGLRKDDISMPVSGGYEAMTRY
ncbi:hypothetical protein SRHO_G00273750 [Serrasalmus rhombeus]